MNSNTLSRYANSQQSDQTLRAEREAVVDEVSEQISREFGKELRNRDKHAQIRERISTLVSESARRRGAMAFTTTMVGSIVEEIFSLVVGMGFLDRLLPPVRSDIVEIALLPSGKLYIKRKGGEHFEPSDIQPQYEEVIRVVDKLLGAQNKALTEATPSVDARLPKTSDNPAGGRVKVVHSAIAPGVGFPALSVRLFETRAVTPDMIVEWGSATRDMMTLMADAVHRKLRILIAGGTGTGKTTLLSAMCSSIPDTERIVKIEDPEEIFLNKPHVVTLEARYAPPGSPIPSYTVSDAVNDAMRMSPDRLIVGEVRKGDAALALFRAQMSDHPGLSTFHAEDPLAAVHRLSVIMFSDAGVRIEAAKAFFASAVDIYVQINFATVDQNSRPVDIHAADGIRAAGGSVRTIRRVSGIWQVEQALKSGDVQFTPIFNADHEQVGEITRLRAGG
ncbi:MAG: CpaF family protein [Thermoflexales bacterium]|nr:CpaF family protein [Thermoflexales bacterium]